MSDCFLDRMKKEGRKMKAKTIAAVVAAAGVFSAVALTPAPVQAGEGQGNDPRLAIKLDAQSVRFFGTAKDGDDWTSDFKARDLHVGVSVKLTDKLRAQFRLDLARLIGLDESDKDGMDKLEEALEQAEIVYTHDKGTGKFLKTVRFGKGTTALRELVTSNPVYKDSLLYEVAHQDEVLGITFEVNPGEIAENIEATIFECKEGDLRIESCLGLAAGINGVRTGIENLTANAGILVAERMSDDEYQTRARVGLVYEGGNGRWKAYANGMYLKDVPGAEESDFAVQVGAEMQAGPGRVVVEFDHLDNVANQITAAYNMPIGASLILSPYIRHRFNETGADETEVGVNARAMFGWTPQSMN